MAGWDAEFTTPHWGLIWSGASLSGGERPPAPTLVPIWSRSSWNFGDVSPAPGGCYRGLQVLVCQVPGNTTESRTDQWRNRN